MHRLVIATRNPHKTREFAQILGDRYTVCDLTSSPEISEAQEVGKTFKENAVIKARNASEHLSDLVVGDDSGLEVDALRGAPGIFSARYAGPQATDRENLEKLLQEITSPEGQSPHCVARFRCVLALAEKGQLIQTFEGVAEGTIVRSPRGEAGFGYDPVFRPDGFAQTFAEMPAETKNQISHRARAIAQLAEYLAKRLTDAARRS